MPKGYFKRVGKGSYRVRLDLTGPVTTVHEGDVIHAEVSTFKDVIGFEFVGWAAPQNVASTDPHHPSRVDGSDHLIVVQAAKQPPTAPHKAFLERIKQEQELKATEIKFIEEEATPEPPPVPSTVPENKENDKQALIEYLTNLDNKKWFIMKKEDARSYLERLEIDISNLPNSKNEFIKYLKDYIKSKKQ